MITDRGHLLTETRNERSQDIDTLSIGDAFDVISVEDMSIAAAVAKAKPQICQAVELVIDAFRSGGRLIYVGAGTSGRLGVLDAAECPPTFLSDPSMVVGIIAGGPEALRKSIEGAEDRPEDGAVAIDAHEISSQDVVFGIATGGTTPYVHGGLIRAKQRGAKTVFLACVPFDDATDDADVSIRVLTGSEVVTGSTRMKAGTATKLVLNMVSTLSMIGIGKVLGNLMVDVNARACTKLTERAVRIIREVVGVDHKEAESLLERAAGRVKTAIVMHACEVSAEEAERRLASAEGHLRRVIPRSSQ